MVLGCFASYFSTSSRVTGGVKFPKGLKKDLMEGGGKDKNKSCAFFQIVGRTRTAGKC